MSAADTIAELVAEANRLAAKREGVHDMAKACANVRGYAELAGTCDEGPAVERMTEIVGNMRTCVHTGFFPKPQLVEMALHCD